MSCAKAETVCTPQGAHPLWIGTSLMLAVVPFQHLLAQKQQMVFFF
jgi:hypothetical protein